MQRFEPGPSKRTPFAERPTAGAPRAADARGAGRLESPEAPSHAVQMARLAPGAAEDAQVQRAEARSGGGLVQRLDRIQDAMAEGGDGAEPADTGGGGADAIPCPEAVCSLGESGPEVTEAKRLLLGLGYDVGANGAVFDEPLALAVDAFANEYHVEFPHGVLTEWAFDFLRTLAAKLPPAPAHRGGMGLSRGRRRVREDLRQRGSGCGRGL